VVSFLSAWSSGGRISSAWPVRTVHPRPSRSLAEPRTDLRTCRISEGVARSSGSAIGREAHPAQDGEVSAVRRGRPHGRDGGGGWAVGGRGGGEGGRCAGVVPPDFG